MAVGDVWAPPRNQARGAAMMASAAPRAGGGKVFSDKQRTDSAENVPTEMIQFHL